MRTGIYVQKPTTVTIRASAAQDAAVQLRRLEMKTCEADARALQEPVAAGTHRLDAGIYLIVSSSPMQIEGDGVTTQIVANDKDPWPELAATVVGLVPGANMKSLQMLFAVAKGIEVDDGPAGPESPEEPTESADGSDDT